VAWKGSKEGEFEEHSELVGVRVARKRRFSTAARGFILADAVLAVDEDARATPSRQAAACPGAWRRWTQQLCPGGSASPPSARAL